MDYANSVSVEGDLELVHCILRSDQVTLHACVQQEAFPYGISGPLAHSLWDQYYLEVHTDFQRSQA